MSGPARLLLASTSPYRRELLSRLRVPFDTIAPHSDETPFTGESPDALALRLAQLKAQSVSTAWPDRIIIGSDQVAVVDGTILGKPGTHARAVEQLALMRARVVRFHTGLCVLNSRTAREQTALVTIIVQMRNYSDTQIERYLRADAPYDCAGSARIEALGISLVEKLEGEDPTALIGLPLIALCRMLRDEGIDLP
jgi:septum formation protein